MELEKSVKVYLVFDGYADYEGGGDEFNSIWASADKAIVRAKELIANIDSGPEFEGKKHFNETKNDDFVFYSERGDGERYVGVQEVEVQE